MGESVVSREQSWNPHQSPKQKKPELTYATISKESVISGQIPNSDFPGKSSYELKNPDPDHEFSR